MKEIVLETELARTIQLIDVNGRNRYYQRNQFLADLAEKRKARKEELKTNVIIGICYIGIPLAMIAWWIAFGY